MAYPVPVSVTESFSNVDATSHLVTLPSANAGDLLVMFFSVDGAPTITDVWTQLYKTAQGTVISGACYAKISVGGEAANIDVVTNNTESFAAQVYRYAAGNWYGASVTDGISVGTPVASANAGVSTPDAPAVTAAWGSQENAFITVLHDSTGSTITGTPTNYTDSVNTNPAGGTATAGVVSLRRSLTAASDDPSSWTTSTTGVATVTNTIVIRPYESSPNSWVNVGGKPRGNLWYR